MPTREAEGANIELMLFSLSGRRSKVRVDWTFPGNTYRHLQLSEQAQFLVFAKGVPPSYENAYLDLRNSAVAAPVPVRIPGDGSLYQAHFGKNDSDLYYVLEQTNGARACFHLDLAGQLGNEPVKLSRAGRVDYCIAQPAP